MIPAHQVPLIISNTLQLAVKAGIVFRAPSAVETMGKINLFAFDKTGTLSQGSLSVLKSFAITSSVESLVMNLAASSDHPIARAVAEHTRTSNSASANTKDAHLNLVKALPGMGISAEFAGFPLLGGNAAFVDMKDDARVSEYREEGLTIFAVTYGGQLVALYGLQDTVRPGVPELIANLKKRRNRVMLISGDNVAAVKLFAKKIGIEPDYAIGEATPGDKAGLIRKYQTEGYRVCYTGDGVNDTVALSEADVSISVASGSDIAVAASDIVFLGNDMKHSLESTLAITALGRFHIISALVWCCCYFIFAILLASGAFVKVRIAPRWAGLGELVSIVPVLLIAAAMPLRWARIQPKTQQAQQ